jgi:hypothetical protein
MSAGPQRAIEAAPELARMAGGMWWRSARWTAGVGVRASVRLVRAAADPILMSQVAVQLGSDLRDYARDLLGVTELDQRVKQLMPAPTEVVESNGNAPENVSLRVKGALLLRAAAALDEHDGIHPAYARILTELAPDEGRILRLMATHGAQPSVDVRATHLFGTSGDLIAGGLNMIGAQAGCRHHDQVPAYLNNLERLGLIWFSHEPLRDPMAYQVLEAQPEVMDAIKTATRARTVERSIALTPFGLDFCETCLPLDDAEVETLTQD